MKIMIKSICELEYIIKQLKQSEDTQKILGLNTLDVLCPTIKEFPTTIEVSFIIGTQEKNIYSYIYKWLKRMITR